MPELARGRTGDLGGEKRGRGARMAGPAAGRKTMALPKVSPSQFSCVAMGRSDAFVSLPLHWWSWAVLVLEKITEKEGNKVRTRKGKDYYNIWPTGLLPPLLEAGNCVVRFFFNLRKHWHLLICHDQSMPSSLFIAPSLVVLSQKIHECKTDGIVQHWRRKKVVKWIIS